jgi:uncharacterized protein
MLQAFNHWSSSLCHSLVRHTFIELLPKRKWAIVNILACGLLLYSLSSCQYKNNTPMENTTANAFRLKPGQDLKQEIQKLVTEKQIKAGWINTGVGSLTNYNIRFANQPNGSTGGGHFEIVSLTGTVSINGSHIHISISDSTGKTIGGHLMDGCTVYTTAEIVIGSSNNFTFKREKDGTTPWEELQVEEVKELFDN